MLATVNPESDANISKTHFTFFIIENDDYFKNFSG